MPDIMKFLETFVQSGNSGSQIFRENTWDTLFCSLNKNVQKLMSRNEKKTRKIPWNRQKYCASVSRVAFLERGKNFVKTPNWRIFLLFLSKSGNSGAECPAISRNFSCFRLFCVISFCWFHEKFRRSELPGWTNVSKNFIIYGVFTNVSNFKYG